MPSWKCACRFLENVLAVIIFHLKPKSQPELFLCCVIKQQRSLGWVSGWPQRRREEWMILPSVSLLSPPPGLRSWEEPPQSVPWVAFPGPGGARLGGGLVPGLRWSHRRKASWAADLPISAHILPAQQVISFSWIPATALELPGSLSHYPVNMRSPGPINLSKKKIAPLDNLKASSLPTSPAFHFNSASEYSKSP